MQANYKNYTIRKISRGYEVLGMLFPSLQAATDKIDSFWDGFTSTSKLLPFHQSPHRRANFQASSVSGRV